MKSLLPLLAIVAALFVIERAFISAETFTEGVRVSPDTVTLKPGQYVRLVVKDTGTGMDWMTLERALERLPGLLRTRVRGLRVAQQDGMAEAAAAGALEIQRVPARLPVTCASPASHRQRIASTSRHTTTPSPTIAGRIPGGLPKLQVFTRPAAAGARRA